MDESKRMSRLKAERVLARAFGLPPTSSNVTKKQSHPFVLGPNSTASINDAYLQHTGARFFLEDLVKRLQEQRPELPAPFIASYWSAVASGSNVRGRDFEYINGCLQNRTAFLSQLQRAFASVDPTLRTWIAG